VTVSADYLDKPAFSMALANAARTTRRSKAMIFVHGFDNRFDDAAYRFAQIVQDSKVPVIPVLFSWPSQGIVGLRAYQYDQVACVGAGLVCADAHRFKRFCRRHCLSYNSRITWETSPLVASQSLPASQILSLS
jgi:hypothetical protein